jgi:RNA polymerase sigma-70 factor, ECF subfamily
MNNVLLSGTVEGRCTDVESLSQLYRFALQLTHDQDRAADLVQDTAERALRARIRYVETGAFDAWLRTIMRRIFIDEWRKGGGGNTGISLDHRTDVLPPVAPSQLWHVYFNEIGRQLAALPADQQRVLTSAINGDNDTDVAAELGMTPARLRKERFKLRRQLGAKFGL